MTTRRINKIGNLVRLKVDVGLLRAGTYGVVMCNITEPAWEACLVLIEGESIACFDHELELISEYHNDKDHQAPIQM